MDTLGTRLKTSRKRMKLSQQELAEKVGTSQYCINDLEHGRHQSGRFISAIADALQVDYYWLERGGSLDGEPSAQIGSKGSFNGESHVQLTQRMMLDKFDLTLEGPFGSRHLSLNSDELDLLRKLLLDE